LQHVHFIAIGGAGMSGIAKVLLAQGYQVSGSDLKPSEWTARLEQLGARVYIGHDAANLDGADLVVVSSAIGPDNPELLAAQTAGLPVVHRADMLARLMTTRRGIAVAGAHGKTTTTSMIAMVLERCGLDPTVLVGGEVTDMGGNAKLGFGDYLVAETDESDGSFLKLHPRLAVVTNIDDDHLDHYGTMEHMESAYATFLDQVPADGRCVLCADDTRLRRLAAGRSWPVVWYGTGTGADWEARRIAQANWSLTFNVRHRGRELGPVRLRVIGVHNALNALATLAVADGVGLGFAEASSALAEFRGVARRMELVGEAGGVRVLDDFAHHPTEIRTTLETVAGALAGRVLCIFQPHRYSRTRLLAAEFGTAFLAAQRLFLADIYPGPGEAPEPGVDSGLIARAVRESGQEVAWMHCGDELVAAACAEARPGDAIITVGAGDIWKLGPQLLGTLQQVTRPHAGT
jgi:UDP-N-acetylmuramate--alanine ligase